MHSVFQLLHFLCESNNIPHEVIQETTYNYIIPFVIAERELSLLQSLTTKNAVFNEVNELNVLLNTLVLDVRINNGSHEIVVELFNRCVHGYEVFHEEKLEILFSKSLTVGVDDAIEYFVYMKRFEKNKLIIDFLQEAVFGQKQQNQRNFGRLFCVCLDHCYEEGLKKLIDMRSNGLCKFERRHYPMSIEKDPFHKERVALVKKYEIFVSSSIIIY